MVASSGSSSPGPIIRLIVAPRRLHAAPHGLEPKILWLPSSAGGRAIQSTIFAHALGDNVPVADMVAELQAYEAEAIVGRETLPSATGTGRPATWWF
jgi:hypothetical protein